MQSHIRKVYACLAVTCHLHFWQNDRGLLRATAVTRGWNRYRNKSQHRKSTMEKKILPMLLQGFEPATFQSRVRRSNHWAIPAPITCTLCVLFMVLPSDSETITCTLCMVFMVLPSNSEIVTCTQSLWDLWQKTTVTPLPKCYIHHMRTYLSLQLSWGDPLSLVGI